MSINPRSVPPGPLSTRNSTARSERADGGGLGNPARGVGDTPAKAASRSKALQEDVGRADRRLRGGVTAPAGVATVRPVGRSNG